MLHNDITEEKQLSLRDFDQLNRYYESRPDSYLKVKLEVCKEQKLDLDHSIDLISSIMSKRKKTLEEKSC